MIKVNEQLTKQELVADLRQYLPFFVSYGEDSIFEVKSVSNTYFRDTEPIEMYSLSTQELTNQYYPDTKKIAIRRKGLVITKDIEEAQKHFKQVKAKRIQEEFPEIEKKYFEAKQFMVINPNYFI